MIWLRAPEYSSRVLIHACDDQSMETVANSSVPK